jgi:hypothetical protein
LQWFLNIFQTFQPYIPWGLRENGRDWGWFWLVGDLIPLNPSQSPWIWNKTNINPLGLICNRTRHKKTQAWGISPWSVRTLRRKGLLQHLLSPNEFISVVSVGIKSDSTRTNSNKGREKAEKKLPGYEMMCKRWKVRSTSLYPPPYFQINYLV